MFISAVKLGILTWTLMGIDSLLEPASSGSSKNCSQCLLQDFLRLSGLTSDLLIRCANQNITDLLCNNHSLVNLYGKQQLFVALPHWLHFSVSVAAYVILYCSCSVNYFLYLCVLSASLSCIDIMITCEVLLGLIADGVGECVGSSLRFSLMVPIMATQLCASCCLIRYYQGLLQAGLTLHEPCTESAQDSTSSEGTILLFVFS